MPRSGRANPHQKITQTRNFSKTTKARINHTLLDLPFSMERLAKIYAYKITEKTF